MPVSDARDAPSDGRADEVVVPIVAEEVEIDTVREETGLVRIRKIVRHDAKAIEAPSYQERVETVRVPKGYPVEKAVGPHQSGTVLVIPVYEERLVRQLILVEEIHVRKLREISQNSKVVQTRREEVVIERFNAATSEWVPEPRDPPDLPDQESSKW